MSACSWLLGPGRDQERQMLQSSNHTSLSITMRCDVILSITGKEKKGLVPQSQLEIETVAYLGHMLLIA